MKKGDKVSHKTSEITGVIVMIDKAVDVEVVVDGERQIVKTDVLHVDNGLGTYYGPRDEWQPAE